MHSKCYSKIVHKKNLTYETWDYPWVHFLDQICKVNQKKKKPEARFVGHLRSQTNNIRLCNKRMACCRNARYDGQVHAGYIERKPKISLFPGFDLLHLAMDQLGQSYIDKNLDENQLSFLCLEEQKKQHTFLNICTSSFVQKLVQPYKFTFILKLLIKSGRHLLQSYAF